MLIKSGRKCGGPLKSFLQNKDVLLVVALSLFMGCISSFGWLLMGRSLLIVVAIIVFIVLITIQIIIYRRFQAQIKNQEAIQEKRQASEYRQMESLFSLYSVLKINKPLPPMRGWAISPDFANIIMSLIYELRPKVVLEASSGVSTLIAAYSMRELDCGRLISFEHEESYAGKTIQNIALHGLQDVAKVIYSPLKDVDVHGERRLWYDISSLKAIESIDLLIIDGPPRDVNELARYPALPLLFDKLSDRAVVLIDDADRKDEREIIDRWLKEFSCFTREAIDTEKGAAILRRNNGKAS